MSGNIDEKNIGIINGEEDIKQLRKENKSRINKFLVEFIQENIVPLRKTNSMIELRPHSHIIDSKIICDSSINENINNLNINELIFDNINKKIMIHKKTTNKKSSKMYDKLFMEREEI